MPSTRAGLLRQLQAARTPPRPSPSRARTAVEVGEQVFQVELAGEVRAEKVDVRPDDRAEVHDDRGRRWRPSRAGTPGASSTDAPQPPPSGSGRTPPEGPGVPGSTSRPASGCSRRPTRSAPCLLRAGRRRNLPGTTGALGRGRSALAGAWPFRCMSMLPRKCAPSAIATAGRRCRRPPTRCRGCPPISLALMLPVSSPQTTTAFAKTCALMRPFWPIVSVWSRSSILPSTCPSIVRSSLPSSSPLIDDGFADQRGARRGRMPGLDWSSHLRRHCRTPFRTAPRSRPGGVHRPGSHAPPRAVLLRAVHGTGPRMSRRQLNAIAGRG